MHFGSKAPQQATEVLPVKFYDQFLSDFARSWKPAPIWDLLPLEAKPGMLSMLAGKPNPATSPFKSLTISVRSPDSSDGEVTEMALTDDEMATALQYHISSGIPSLVEWMTNLMIHEHGRTDDSWRLSIGAGAQDLLNKAFYALLNPGDSMIVEHATYPGAVPTLVSLGLNIVSVATDADGIIPSSLEELLDSWPVDKEKPKLLYTIPYGSNPTGVTTTHERRVEILYLARKHNLLIIEDDPYFYLYFGKKPRPASYFSLEQSLGGEVGRVLRLESFSKVLAAGFRFGWVAGPKPILDAIDAHTTNTTVQCSSLTQVLYYKALTAWGISGFLNHTVTVAEFYKVRRDIFEVCLRRHLTGLAEWVTPVAGMFYWVKLLLPPTSEIDIRTSIGDEGDSKLLLQKRALEKNVLALPGCAAFFDNRISPFVRLSFSMMSEADMNEALSRLASALREEWDASGLPIPG